MISSSVGLLLFIIGMVLGAATVRAIADWRFRRWLRSRSSIDAAVDEQAEREDAQLIARNMKAECEASDLAVDALRARVEELERGKGYPAVPCDHCGEAGCPNCEVRHER